VHQWHPYLSPDTKVERAWLAPLRSLDVNGLGLVRDWCGETPAQATARERLGDRGPTPPVLDMKSALCVEPPGAGPDATRSFFSVAERSRSRPVARLPNPRTWRIFHADAVKRAYGNANRRRVPSPSHLRQHLLAEKSSQLLLGARPVATPLRIPYSKLKEIVETLTTEEKEALIHFKESPLFSKASQKELQKVLTDAKVDADLTGSTKQAAKSLVEVAVAMAKGQPYLERLTDEEYVEAVEKMSEEELQEAWKFLCSERSTEIMGTKLSADVEEKLLSELQEDEQLEGSAEDELQLALEILATLRDVGVKPTAMDCKALLQAAHALGDVDLAGKVMESVAGSLAEQEEPESELGPAGQAMLQVMEDGGWDRDASEDFLKGKRVFTRRDPETSLGKMQTRYLDPLLGAEASEPYAKDRDDLLQAFTKPYTGKITPFNRKNKLAQDEDEDADSMNEKSERRQSVTWTSQKKDETSEETVEERHVVTRSDILIAGVQHPEEAAALVALAGRDGKGLLMYSNLSVLHEHLDRLGLTPPKKNSESKKLLAFAVEVLSEAAETRAMVA